MDTETVFAVVKLIVAALVGAGVTRFWIVRKAIQLLAVAPEVRDVLRAADRVAASAQLRLAAGDPVRVDAETYVAEKAQAQAALDRVLSLR